MPDELIPWTAWLAMAALVAGATVRVGQMPRPPASDHAARWCWTMACVLLWIHVTCAFAFVHHWSHTHAYLHTARRTAEFTGFHWGGGVYFNYLLLLVWAADAGWWWIAPNAYRQRPAIVSRVIIGFVAFMAFNATVVFGTGVLRWVAAATALFLGLSALRCRTGGAAL